MSVRRTLERLLRADTGAASVETALVMPALALMSFAGVEVSQLIARNTELENAAAEATAISLAARPRTQTAITEIERVIEASTGLADSAVVLSRSYRCGVEPARVEERSACAANAIVSEYIEITLTETHHPVWTSIGVGEDIEFTVNKSVQIG